MFACRKKKKEVLFDTTICYIDCVRYIITTATMEKVNLTMKLLFLEEYHAWNPMEEVSLTAMNPFRSAK